MPAGQEVRARPSWSNQFFALKKPNQSSTSRHSCATVWHLHHSVVHACCPDAFATFTKYFPPTRDFLGGFTIAALEVSSYFGSSSGNVNLWPFSRAGTFPKAPKRKWVPLQVIPPEEQGSKFRKRRKHKKNFPGKENAPSREMFPIPQKSKTCVWSIL